MEKENLIALTRELNNQRQAFVNICNKLENEYFHISDIYFSIVKREYYILELPEILNILRISVKRVVCKKNMNHIEININEKYVADELRESVLPEELNKILCWYISNFSNRIYYVRDIKEFIYRGI